MTTTLILALIITWTIIAFAIGLTIGRVIRAADRREQPTADDFPDDPRDIDGLD